MDSWALCCVVLCLLGAGPADAEIYQTPEFLLTRAGRKVTLQCGQNLIYNAMYWYRQDPGQGLRLIYCSAVTKDVQAGELAEGYSVSREEKGLFPLTLGEARANQSSWYFCSGSASQCGEARARPCTNPPQPSLQLPAPS